jgi:hypothetical protein
MKPKDAAARMTMLDDSVRLPIAAKMKERALSQVLANMAPGDAKILTERLANALGQSGHQEGQGRDRRQRRASPAPRPRPSRPTQAGGRRDAADAAAPKGKGAPKKAG